MTVFATLLAAFTVRDAAALAALIGALLAVEVLLHPRVLGPRSAGEMMSRWRERWFLEAARRENRNRILDTNLLNGLRAAIAFYISGALLALGGAIAFIGQTDQLAMVAQDLAVIEQANRAKWIVKLLVVVALLIVAFLEFVWAHRIFGYCAVLLGAIPDRGDDGEAVARRGARLNILASRHFNRGLRAMYFSLTAMAWLVGPWVLMGATAFTTWIMLRREFFSETRAALQD